METETTGLAPPVHVLELAALRMRGWERIGEPFRKLLKQPVDILPEASRLQGITREVLERDGESPHAVHVAFDEYARDLPLVSYNLDYNLGQALKLEWERLKLAPASSTGFCALRLAHRLLDPVTAGDCKLQTMRQYYRLPERGAHTALADVLKVADLFGTVLRPIAAQQGLDTWIKMAAFASEEWYSSRLIFGKHKGRSIHDAAKDPALRQWLELLAGSSNAKSASMGRWDLRNGAKEAGEPVFVATGDGEASPGAVVIYVHPDLQRLRGLIAASRVRLAELEASSPPPLCG